MKEPLISVLMPTFNRPEFITTAVTAVLNQSYRNVEVIVKDGGSPIGDRLPKDSRLRYIQCPDRGIAHAMNQMLGVAEGELLTWANDDDIMLPGTLAHAIRFLDYHAWGYGSIRVNDDAGRFLWVAHGPNPWNLVRNIQANGVPQPACFWTRWAADLIGEFDEEIGVCCDADYWDRLGQLFDPVRTTKVLAWYSRHEGSLSVAEDKVLRESAQRVRVKHERVG